VADGVNWGAQGVNWGLFSPKIDTSPQNTGNAFAAQQAQQQQAQEQRRQFEATHGLRQQEFNQRASQHNDTIGIARNADGRASESHKWDMEAKRIASDDKAFERLGALNDTFLSAKTPEERAYLMNGAVQSKMITPEQAKQFSGSENSWRMTQARLQRMKEAVDAERAKAAAGVDKTKAETEKDRAQAGLYSAQAGAADQNWAPHPANEELIFNKKTGEVRRSAELAQPQGQGQGAIPESKKFREARDKELGEARGKAIADLPRIEDNVGVALKTVDSIRNHPGRDNATGLFGSVTRIPGYGFMPSTSARGFESFLDQAKGQTFLEAFNALRGGGQITQVEGEKATAALARLDRAQNKSDFEAALNDLQDILKTGLDRARFNAGRGERVPVPSTPGSQQQQPSAQQLQPGMMMDHPSGRFRFKGGNPADQGSWEKVQ
jgi:hypothetical protein